MSYPKMGSYVSPFLPSYQSTAALAGGDRLEYGSSGQDFAGVRLQGKEPAAILLYRGGNKILGSPVVATTSRSFRGPDLCCKDMADQPRHRVPVATNKTITPCGSKRRGKNAIRRSFASTRPPAPQRIDETFLANQATLAAPQTFRESASSYQLPQGGVCGAVRRGVNSKKKARRALRRARRQRRKCCGRDAKMPAVDLVNGVAVPVGIDNSCTYADQGLDAGPRDCGCETTSVFFNRDLADTPPFYPTDFGYGAPGGTHGRGPALGAGHRRSFGDYAGELPTRAGGGSVDSADVDEKACPLSTIHEHE